MSQQTKIYKISIILSLFLVYALTLFLFFVGRVYAEDFFYPVNTPITIGGNTYLIGAGSRATDLVVDDISITIVVPEGSFFIFKSPDRFDLNNGYTETKCGTYFNAVIINNPTTVTITPDPNTICTLNDDSPETSAPTVPSSPAPTPASTETSNNTITPVTTPEAPALEVTLTPTTSNKTENRIYNFGTTTLKNGSRGDAVKELQRFLNQVLNLGLVVDGKLGPKTITVIKKWQKDNGLQPDGLVGIKTKRKMNASIQSSL